MKVNTSAQILSCGLLITLGLASCGRAQQAPAPPVVPPLAAAPTPGLSVHPTFRPPSVPLVVNDPYLSIWSNADRLTDVPTRHWTGQDHPLAGLIRVDGKAFRVMGDAPAAVPALRQISVRVTPTRSIYEFENDTIHLTLTFMTPMLPDDIEALARPATYLTWNARSIDGKNHRVELYQDVSAQIAVNTPEQEVVWNSQKFGALTALRVGTQGQTYLRPAGDITRIDWGYAYAAAPTKQSKSAIGAGEVLQNSFVKSGVLPATADTKMPRPANENTPTLGFAFDLGQVGATPVSRHLTLAYDQIYNIKYFGQKLQPYWRRNGADAPAMLAVAERDYPSLVARCAKFDAELTADAVRAGGAKYAQIVALAYRQAIGATGIAADANGQPLVFPKENSSNGDIATVDVFFPMSPIFLLTNPTLVKAMMVPIFDYSASERWTFPNAPHDLGLYPVVSGRDDGGEAMPVEESGNMLILSAAVAQTDGNTKFLDKWWPQLTQWAQFLEQYGLDPENQLSTDDFMGHLAHNANLSVKAILGLAAYGELCRIKGDTVNAKKYRELAAADAKHWIEVADGGEASLLAFDKPGTWSQKYNMVWDDVLGLNVFPRAVKDKEIALYLKKMQPYGVPLDSRTNFGDLDHSFFSATMANSDADFQAMIAPFYAYLDGTNTRVPMADLYKVDDINSDGFRARPVVGGAFIKMIADRKMWAKWVGKANFKATGWAPMPIQPVLTPILPTSKTTPLTWRYTTQAPPADWTKTDFDDSVWQTGAAPFGNFDNNPTKWTTPDIWIRRDFTLPTGKFSDLHFSAFYDEDITIYVDGVLASQEPGYTSGYDDIEIRPEAAALLKPGAKITIAAHCHQTYGGQIIDLGLSGALVK